MLFAMYKPFGVLSQFTADGSSHRSLAEFGLPAGVYPIGRLDADSEGLLLLSNEAALNQRLLNPRHAHPREYWAQVEGIPTPDTLRRISQGGLEIQGHRTLPCRVWMLSGTDAEAQIATLPERVPPVRFRRTIPTAWIALELTEGKNRQVRRMTAAVGFPTLRLVRVRIGSLMLPMTKPGTWRELTMHERMQVLHP
jgi:23S rRNA pseudouridine2457 synthase